MRRCNIFRGRKGWKTTGFIDAPDSVEYDKNMKRATHAKRQNFPVVTSLGEDGYYIVQCPTLRGAFTQGKTIDEALHNIKEVIELCLEEKESREYVRAFGTDEVSLHTVTV